MTAIAPYSRSHGHQPCDASTSKCNLPRRVQPHPQPAGWLAIRSRDDMDTGRSGVALEGRPAHRQTRGGQIFRGPTERLPRLPPNLSKQALADRGGGRCRQALIAAP